MHCQDDEQEARAGECLGDRVAETRVGGAEAGVA
jgi:hypothetical protein